MKYLLDTNICIYLINGNELLKKKVREIGVYSLSISNITLAELYFGAYHSKKVEANLRRLSLFKANLTIHCDSEESAELFGKIKSKLRSKGRIIEDFDMMIASIACANHCTLVTNNINHFKAIEELPIENWLE